MHIRLYRNLNLALAAFALLLAGCEGTVQHMRSVPAEAAPVAPQPGKALVVFMRSSGIGAGVQSSVFDLKDSGPPALVGIVAAKAKLAYHVQPGEFLFMVIGENADFMSANVVAGKTYYVRIEPRMGVWKARFGLEPIRQKELNGAQFVGALGECKWVEKNADSDSWAGANMTSIMSKRAEFYPDWIKQAESARPRLLADDGK